MAKTKETGINYGALFTLRSDGRYQASVLVKGRRKYLYDRDPKKLYEKVKAAENPPPVTFAKAADRWEEVHRKTISERTWHNYAPHYRDMIASYGDKPLSDITPVLIIADLNRAKAQGYSRTIVNTRKVIFSMILEQAIADGELLFNPAQGIKLPKNLPKTKRRAPTEAETQIILSSIDKPFGFFAFLLLCTGLRKAEALALLKSDIDLDAGVIHITKALTWINGIDPTVKAPKSDAGTRDIPIIGLLRPHLENAMQGKSPELFPILPSNRSTRSDGYMTERGYEGAWQRYCEATGLNLTAHQLRHGTATLLFEAGVDAYTAQKILGHAQIATTMQIYTELRQKQMAKSVKLFDDYLMHHAAGI